MSNNYDNWDRLVKVVLRREHDRQLALADSESEESSLKYSICSSSFRSESNPNDQNPQLELAVLDDIINRLLGYPLHSRSTNRKVNLLENEIRYLCNTSREIFISQPNLLEIEAPIKICGNIHGQFPDLLSLLETGGYPPEAKYLFLGGYADYGKQSIETICLLLAFKIKYPENFLFLRGNHERMSLSGIYEFYDECKRRLNITLWKVFVDCFICLPAAALINDKILCRHGGLSPELDNLDQIRNFPRPMAVPNLLWSNPHSNLKGWGMNDRGISNTGENRVYDFFADRQLVTLFSVPNFAGQFGNAGAIMCVDESLVCTFEIFKPALRKGFC